MLLCLKFHKHFEIETNLSKCGRLYIENENIFMRGIKEDLTKQRGMTKNGRYPLMYACLCAWIVIVTIVQESLLP